MKNKREWIPYPLRKALMFWVHVLAMISLIYGFAIIYSNNNFKKGLSSLNEENYEDSPKFVADMVNDITYIFDYERHKYIFEKDGVFDKSIEVFSISEGPDKETSYTVGDVLKYAQNLGFYIDEEYQVSRTSLYQGENRTDDNEYLVTWKSYARLDEIREPGEAYMSLEELSEEVMAKLSKYYVGYYNLKLKPRNIHYVLEYGDYRVTSAQGMTPEKISDYGRYVLADSEAAVHQGNMAIIPNNLYYQASLGIYNPATESSTENEEYKIYIGVDTAYPQNDVYYQGKLRYEAERAEYFMGMMHILLGGVFAGISFLFLAIWSGKSSSRDTQYKAYSIDKWSIEFRIFFLGLSIILLWFMSERIGNKFIHSILAERFWSYGERLVLYIIVYVCVYVFVFSLIRSYKAGLLWKNSFVKHIKEEGSIYKDNYTFTRRFASNFGIYTITNLTILIFIMYLINVENTLIDRFIILALVLGIIVINLLVFQHLYRRSLALDKISESVENIANGDTGSTLELEDFSGKEKLLAERVNNIGNGLDTAINEQVKSERLKADLITNVSHDIRTPLTSIINYIDLIKRENIQNENIKNYIHVLESKSLHLKNLTEDLLEASKASSGNISVDLTEIDFVQLIKQANGEFAEKYESRNLQMICKLPEEGVKIMADGRHLWRILENIYINAYKYAIEGSRVYINLDIIGEKAVFVIKNVSEHALNISPEELTMRFVRGDISRTTEGSGLGLSIAKSLSDIQNAEFAIEIDGDLFKAKLAFLTKTDE